MYYNNNENLDFNSSLPRRINVDCYGLTVEEYKFLLDDIEEAIAEGNRKYGYGEPGYIGADGYFYPLPEDVILPESKPKSKPKPNPKRFRLKSKSKLRPQIHYHHRMRTRSKQKQRPIVKGFR
jgi:hypothetical protein